MDERELFEATVTLHVKLDALNLQIHRASFEL
jgi:hypothetical protein